MENLRETLDVFPSDEDFSVTRTSCRQKNIVFGQYDSTDHYLDVHFNLLREDLLAPLRQSLDSYRRNDSSYKSALELYENVKYLHKITTLNEIAAIIQVDNQSSRKIKLKPGSLLILSEDNFQCLIFGKILDCLPKKNQFVVSFPCENTLSTELTYKIFVSKNYYEPYHHVLKALKELKATDFPLKQFLVDVNYKEELPEYFNNSIPQEVPHRKFNKFDELNEKQSEAVRSALTNKFSLIQGPPGTGKTHIGIKIVKNLLRNKVLWHKAPILIISYTNQALDQYLEGLLDETDEIIRVGERSKHDRLKGYNLKNSIKRYFNKNKLVKLLEVKRELNSLYYGLFAAFTGRGIVRFGKFGNYHPDFKSSWFVEAADDDVIDWLLTGVEIFELQVERNSRLIDEMVRSYEESEVSAEKSESEEETFEVPPFYEKHEKLQCKDIIELDEISAEISRLKKMKNLDEDSQEMLTRYKCLLFALHGSTKLPNLSEKYTSLENAEYMDPEKRWKLYGYWRRRYCVDLLEEIRKTEETFRKLSQDYRDYRDRLNVLAMKEKLVVGMTTTCAARMQKTLENLQCPIVIVEEAAFVLESHIIAALSSNCQQLILLGDHKQLRPRVSHSTNSDINTEISLFERMVLNSVPHTTLTTQYRMRPEITRLISPSIYPNLTNETRVENYPSVPGLEKSVYFIDHKYFEAGGGDSSKENLFEANFLVELGKYLVLNGCNGREISVLAAYKRQVERIVEVKRRVRVLRDVEVSTFDEFQGQENGIVLLSLVRSNGEGKIGFLGLVNRISVALSRAKYGFYLIGNMELLSRVSEVWANIKLELISMDAIGGTLRLQCQKHGNVTEVSRPEDFPKDGGCDLECRESLLCRHVCRRKCHPMSHPDLNCEQCQGFHFNKQFSQTR